MRTVDWDPLSGEVKLIDQRLLPGRLEIVTCRNADAVSQAIREMVVRGAPAIGAAAAFGLASTSYYSTTTSLDSFLREIRIAANLLVRSRPTAINLKWAIQRMLTVLDLEGLTLVELRQKLIAEAQLIAEEDVVTNRRLAENGATLIVDGDTIIHHCNTGSLATVEGGTALGVIIHAFRQGKRIGVLVDETRPRLQGARLTAWELEQAGIPYEIITDNAAGHFLRTGQAHKVFFGADRVAANGDVANKIGSYMLALAAHANQVPVFSVFPTTTVDLSLSNGDLIPIEERGAEEVLEIEIHGQRVTPTGAKARNPAFDITPHTLLTALVTEKGVILPPFNVNLLLALRQG